MVYANAADFHFWPSHGLGKCKLRAQSLAITSNRRDDDLRVGGAGCELDGRWGDVSIVRTLQALVRVYVYAFCWRGKKRFPRFRIRAARRHHRSERGVYKLWGVTGGFIATGIHRFGGQHRFYKTEQCRHIRARQKEASPYKCLTMLFKVLS